LHDSLAVRLGGRSAERIVLGQGSTGASNDLAGATELAVKMVREFGLSKTLGPIGYPTGGSAYLGGGGPELSSRPFAEATQAAIDDEVSKLLREAENRATDLLGNHRAELTNLVDLLLEQETVDGAAVYRLAGRPAPSEWIGETVAPRRVAVGDASRLAAGAESAPTAPPAGGSPTSVGDRSHRTAAGPAPTAPPAGGSPPGGGG
jgi:cell division protease FtsH